MNDHLEEGKVAFHFGETKRKVKREKEKGASQVEELPFFIDTKGDPRLLEKEKESPKVKKKEVKKEPKKNMQKKKKNAKTFAKPNKQKQVKKVEKKKPVEVKPKKPIEKKKVEPAPLPVSPKHKLPLILPDGLNVSTIRQYFIPPNSVYLAESGTSDTKRNASKMDSPWSKMRSMCSQRIPPKPKEGERNRLSGEKEPFVINDVVRKKKTPYFLPSQSRAIPPPPPPPKEPVPSQTEYTEQYTARNMWGNTTDEIMNTEAEFWENLRIQSKKEKNKRRRERKRLQEKRKKEESRLYEEQVRRVRKKEEDVESSSWDEDDEDDEEDEEKRKLCRIAHRWRKEERMIKKGPAEEGAISVDTRRELFFRRYGVELSSACWCVLLGVALSPELVSFLEQEDAFHKEKYLVLHEMKQPSPEYMERLKERMKRAMARRRALSKSDGMVSKEGIASSKESAMAKSDEEPGSPKSEDEDDAQSSLERAKATTGPWAAAEQHKRNYELLQQRRRVVIPFQPSPSQINHTYFPPTEYLQYRFVIDLPSEQAPGVSMNVLKEPTSRKRQAAQALDQGRSVHIDGYVVWREKKRRVETVQEKEKKLPLVLRNRVRLEGKNEE